MKFLLVTDTHLGLYNDSDEWLKIVVSIFEEIRYVCTENGIKNIIHGGDFFHNQKSINKKTIDVANYIINDILNDLKIYIIVGNHDIFYKNKIKPNSLQIFENTKNVEIIEKPTTIYNNFDLVPWGFPIPSSNAKYCFGHFEINEFQMNDTFTCKKGMMKISDFEKYKKVYSGHFHKKSEQNNIQYLGSPYQQSFSDINNENGFYIWDKGELIFYKNEFSPRFMKVNVENINNNITGNIIKLVFNSKYNTNEILKVTDKVKEMKPFKLSLDISKVIEQDYEKQKNIKDISLLNTSEIFKEYLKTLELPKNINKKFLNSLSNKLIKYVEI